MEALVKYEEKFSHTRSFTGKGEGIQFGALPNNHAKIPPNAKFKIYYSSYDRRRYSSSS